MHISAAAAARHDLPAVGQLVFQQPGRIEQVRDLSWHGHRGPRVPSRLEPIFHPNDPRLTPTLKNIA
jgi:hypothetical protein